MRKDFGKQSWILPQPVLIIGTYGKDGKPDAMNAAWGGMYDDDKVVICLGSHRTTENIKRRKAFTLSFGDRKNLTACDYVGIVSQNDEGDKMEKAGFTTVKSERVDAPIIEQFPVTMECRLVKFNEDGDVVGEIVNVSAEQSVLDEKDKIDLGKLNLIVFDPVNAAYRAVGEKVGNAFSDGRKLM